MKKKKWETREEIKFSFAFAAKKVFSFNDVTGSCNTKNVTWRRLNQSRISTGDHYTEWKVGKGSEMAQYLILNYMKTFHIIYMSDEHRRLIHLPASLLLK